MVRFAVLGSGSRSNSYIFTDGTTSLVIDNGFALREFRKRLEKAGFDEKTIRVVFLTHTHGDHVRGLENLLKETNALLVHHKDLRLGAIFRRIKEWRAYPVEPRSSHQLHDIDFHPFSLSHDAPGSLGYHFKIGEKRFTLITDTGKTDDHMLRLAARSDVLFLESNYCPVMLKEGPYPPVLQARVSSEVGHLSNNQTADFLNQLEDFRGIPEGEKKALKTQKVYLIHLSENNNTPAKVQETMALSSWQGELKICGRNELVLGEI